jgi:hypothetical protein
MESIRINGFENVWQVIDLSIKKVRLIPIAIPMGTFWGKQ